MQAQLAKEAREFLRGKIRHTPVELSPELSEHLGADVWLKLEFLQITGSFKLRGALFKLARTAAPVVLTCSAGNHGKAVAYAAKQLGKRAIVCVPSSVDPVKRRGIEHFGAEIRISPFRGYDETEDWAMDQARVEHLPFISPFDDEEIIAANGGALADELLEDVPGLRTVVLAVGGGGQAAGFACKPALRQIRSSHL